MRSSIPVIVLVLATTAIPVELRRFDFATLSLNCKARDMAENLILYVPVGLVLTRLGFWRAVMLATLLSLFAETCQFFAMHRYPSPIDLALNVAGAMTGLLVCWCWRIRVPEIRVNARTAWLSVLGLLTVLGLLAIILLRAPVDSDRLSVNCRGAFLPGTLEAHWTFDRIVSGVSYDSSGNGLDGTLKGQPLLADGIHGKAVRLDGENEYVDFGGPVELKLMGSMTISAWIYSISFPRDDAAIVSNTPSYQLDTTVDTGPRTIGFKLGDPCGNEMARYSATALVLNTWYHVAGVYDANERTLDVYLNGRLDNGPLLGTVAPGMGRPASRSLWVDDRTSEDLSLRDSLTTCASTPGL